MSCHGLGLLAPNRYEICVYARGHTGRFFSTSNFDLHNMTLRVCNFGSKQPHLYNAYFVSVAFQLQTTVIGFLSQEMYHQPCTGTRCSLCILYSATCKLASGVRTRGEIPACTGVVYYFDFHTALAFKIMCSV